MTDSCFWTVRNSRMNSYSAKHGIRKTLLMLKVPLRRGEYAVCPFEIPFHWKGTWFNACGLEYKFHVGIALGPHRGYGSQIRSDATLGWIFCSERPVSAFWGLRAIHMSVPMHVFPEHQTMFLSTHPSSHACTQVPMHERSAAPHSAPKIIACLPMLVQSETYGKHGCSSFSKLLLELCVVFVARGSVRTSQNEMQTTARRHKRQLATAKMFVEISNYLLTQALCRVESVVKWLLTTSNGICSAHGWQERPTRGNDATESRS